MGDETKPREPCETCGSKWRMLDQCADCLLRTSREKRIARAITDARAAGIAEGRRQRDTEVADLRRLLCDVTSALRVLAECPHDERVYGCGCWIEAMRTLGETPDAIEAIPAGKDETNG